MKLRILTQNCFESPLSTNRHLRLNILVDSIISQNPDIVFLQEIIFSKTAHRISKIFNQQGYSTYFSPGSILNRGGLFTASKLPFQNFKFIPYQNQGQILSLQLTDRTIQKAFQSFTLKLGLQEINLINTHLLSVYRNSDSETSQLNSQLSELIVQISNLENLILSGDLNFSPDSKFYEQLINQCHLSDSSNQDDLITVSPKNTNRSGFYKNSQNEKLDYTLVSHSLSKNISSKLIFDKPYQIGNKKQHLSDHFGLLTNIAL